MFCSKCGTELDEDNKFCSKCGIKVKRMIKSKKKQILSEEIRALKQLHRLMRKKKLKSSDGMRPLNFF